MAKAALPLELQTKHLTKQEIEARKTEELKLNGNDSLVYKTPRGLSKEERKVYKFLTKELEVSGILNNLDITILKTTANAICMMDECKDSISKNGLVIEIFDKDEDGKAFLVKVIRNPSSKIYIDYVTIFNKGMMELGMSPSSRAKLAQLNVNAKVEKEDEVTKALNGG